MDYTHVIDHLFELIDRIIGFDKNNALLAGHFAEFLCSRQKYALTFLILKEQPAQRTGFIARIKSQNS